MHPLSDGDNPRLVLGLKIRTLRHRRGETLKSIAERSGLSISYLSEIEKGKKYPKPERLLRLAYCLDVEYDELVSLQLEDELAPLKRAFNSQLFRGFPFELFGLAPEDLLALVADDPERGSALLRAIGEVGRSYDVHVEHFLLAALRSYQQLHSNYFSNLEKEARAFRRELGVAPEVLLEAATLGAFLEERWGVRIDRTALAAAPLLSDFRSVMSPGPEETLYLNRRLMPSQETFVLAREIGYRYLGLGERAMTSPWLEVESFSRVFNNFQASYFAGALLLDRDELRRDLGELFGSSTWDPARIVALMRRYRVTPETFLHRLTQIAPHYFGLGEFYFLRFNVPSASHAAPIRLTKWLNTSTVPVPRGFGLNEHFCRRWPALRLLADRIDSPTEPDEPRVLARRIRFSDEQSEFLEISIARRLALRADSMSAVSVGFRLDSSLHETVRFVDDPDIGRDDVNLTCERCGLEDCQERVVPAALLDARQLRRARVRALDELFA